MFRILLYPFAFLYHFITACRNYLYDKGLLKVHHINVFIINVGNLTVGGTGKTPHVEYIARLLKDQYKTASLSRGYGRKTKGYGKANEGSSANSIGDEPMQLYSKLGTEIDVYVGEKRGAAIAKILSEAPSTNMILLDDAYQHRSVKPSFNILLSDYNRPFYKDYILPAGRLREARSSAKRADVVVVSKCPHTLSEEEKNKIKKSIDQYTSDKTPVFFTSIKYQAPVSLSGNAAFSKNILLVTGLAQGNVLAEKIKTDYNLLQWMEYSDHHDYSVSDAKEIIAAYERTGGKDKCILMTEKDMVKFRQAPFSKLLEGLPVFYIPIEIQFIEGKSAFDTMILSSIKKYSFKSS